MSGGLERAGQPALDSSVVRQLVEPAAQREIGVQVVEQGGCCCNQGGHVAAVDLEHEGLARGEVSIQRPLTDAGALGDGEHRGVARFCQCFSRGSRIRLRFISASARNFDVAGFCTTACSLLWVMSSSGHLSISS